MTNPKFRRCTPAERKAYHAGMHMAYKLVFEYKRITSMEQALESLSFMEELEKGLNEIEEKKFTGTGEKPPGLLPDNPYFG